MSEQTQIARRNRTSMLLMFALFLVPVVLAWLVWQQSDPGSSPTTNAGTLVTPARPLPRAFVPVSTDGEALPQDWITGKWTLMYIGTSRCAPPCRDILDRLGQVRLALGENSHRVRRMFLAIDAEAGFGAIGPVDPHFAIGVAAGVGSEALLDSFVIDGPSVGQDHRIYLIDPLGNFMMYYEADDEPNGILRDLRHLLKWSRIG